MKGSIGIALSRVYVLPDCNKVAGWHIRISLVSVYTAKLKRSCIEAYASKI